MQDAPCATGSYQPDDHAEPIQAIGEAEQGSEGGKRLGLL
jgi:hypothetical protein